MYLSFSTFSPFNVITKKCFYSKLKKPISVHHWVLLFYGTSEVMSLSVNGL